MNENSHHFQEIISTPSLVKDNSDYIFKIMVVYFLIFIGKKLILGVLKKYSEFTKNKETINIGANRSADNSISCEIDKLKKEAEVYNNPQNYVKYVKLERQISKLQKQLETLNTNSTTGASSAFEDKSSFSISDTTYIKIILEVLFYLIHIISVFWYRSVKLTIHKNTLLKKNIIFDYYSNEENTCVLIPLTLIIIFEGIFLQKVYEILTKITNSFIKK